MSDFKVKSLDTLVIHSAVQIRDWMVGLARGLSLPGVIVAIPTLASMILADTVSLSSVSSQGLLGYSGVLAFSEYQGSWLAL